MSLSRAKEYLKNFGLEKRIIELNESSATVTEAAHALNVEEGMIAKSLSFMLKSGPILILVAGDKKIDNQKYKGIFHEKAHMIPASEVENIIGHRVGGVCPFGINEGITVYLDSSLKEYSTVYPASGSENSAIPLSIPELEKVSNYKEWIDITK